MTSLGCDACQSNLDAHRVLDVACGTGVLLRKVLDRVPDAEAYGVDASADMLA